MQIGKAKHIITQNSIEMIMRRFLSILRYRVPDAHEASEYLLIIIGYFADNCNKEKWLLENPHPVATESLLNGYS